MELLNKNAECLERELTWFGEVVQARIRLYFEMDTSVADISDIPPPDLSGDPSVYAKVVNHYQFGSGERMIIMLALAPHVRPQVLDEFFLRNKNYDRGFTEFGGITGAAHGGFLPTGETAAFLVAGRNLGARFQLYHLFGPDHPFARFQIIKLQPAEKEDPPLSGILTIEKDYLDLFTSGQASKPTYSSKFPAMRVETELSWDDLVLNHRVRESVDHIRIWVERNAEIFERFARDGSSLIKPGYRALFYGPPGTGKTLTACLIGKATNHDVYKIDLSAVVSKWVGETEKNLARIFDMAENKNWILFFDEADAIFGKRSDSGGSQERYANQEVSYLLQRTEEYPGTVILASNLKGNIDDAFTRRFQSMIYFPMPGARERQQLWENNFHHDVPLAEDIDFRTLAKEYELAGGAVVNILKFCAIRMAARDFDQITEEDVLEGIKAELAKEGKILEGA